MENVKLKMTNDDLSRALDSTSQDQGQLTMLQEQAARLRQEKEMEMYRGTAEREAKSHEAA